MIKLKDILNESDEHLLKLGDCRDENLIDELFGSVSEFGRQIEKNGDDFVYGKIKITYNPKSDIHTFWEIV